MSGAEGLAGAYALEVYHRRETRGQWRRLVRRWSTGRRHHEDIASQLHAEARTALIVSLMSLCCPLALPLGLFLGWRVRARAHRALPDMAEWVSLPFYVASAGLWLGAALGIIAASAVAVCWWC